MTKETATTEIAIALLKKEVGSVKSILSDKGLLLNYLQYNECEINKTLSNYFTNFTNVLQKIVDKYYFSYYEVTRYIYITTENIDYAVDSNLKLLIAIEKLIKFITL